MMWGNEPQEQVMNKTDMDTKTAIMPTLRYRDGNKAIAWLCSTFGFEKNLVVLFVHQRDARHIPSSFRNLPDEFPVHIKQVHMRESVSF